MNWVPRECKTGDMIRVNLGVLHHYGIFVSEDDVIQFGLPPIPEYRMPQDQVEVLSTDIDKFSCGKIVEVAIFDKKERSRAFSPKERVARAKERLGEKGYNLIHNNCEHFVYSCVFGVHYCSVEEEARRRWNSRPLLDVYIMKIPTDMPSLEEFWPQRAAEIENCQNLQLRKNKAADWQLLMIALKKSLNLEPSTLTFNKTKHGKWQTEKGYFSLSHSGDYVAVAVSNKPVGVDLEFADAFSAKIGKLNMPLDALRKKVYTKAELQRASGESELDFIKNWTLKEAVFKFFGKGRYSPSRIPADNNKAVAKQPANLEGAVISACGENIASLRFFLYENDVFIPITSFL